MLMIPTGSICCILFDVSFGGYFAIHIPIFVLTVFLHNTKGLKKHTQTIDS